MSRLFFTSDTHFGHKNIIQYSGRPFSSVEEMDEAMIDNWNSVVTDKDQVWHLGDFSFHNHGKTKEILYRLKGHKHFIWGNHDKVLESDLLDRFETVQDYKELRWNGQKIILMHYPLFTWNGAHKGAWHLHGHCHSSVNWANEDTTRLDVGVDNFNYTPVSFEEVAEILSKKTYKVVDHHEKR